MENNFREILFLIEQIDVLKALLRDMKDGTNNYSWNVQGDTAQDQESSEMLDEARRAGGMGGWGDVKQDFPLLISLLLCLETRALTVYLACVLFDILP